jgi:copper transport protein
MTPPAPAPAPARGASAWPAVGSAAVVVGLAVVLWVGGFEAGAALARAATIAGVLVGAGAAGFVALVHDGRGDVDERRALRSLAVTGLAVAASASLAQLLLQAARVSGDGWAGIGDGQAILDVAGRGVHVATTVRLVGIALVLHGLWRFGAETPTGKRVPVAANAPVLLTGCAITLAAFLAAGHAATREPRLLAAASDLAHVAGGAVWTGGLAALLVVLRHRRRPGSSGDAGAAAAVVARFSRVMVVSLGALLLGAGALALLELERPGALLAGSYGAVLSMKTGVVVAVLAAGAHNHRRLVPSVVAGEEAGWSVLHRTVRFELAALAVAIGLTGVLTGLSPT